MSRTKLNLSQIAGSLFGETLDQSIEKLNNSNYKIIVFVLPGLINVGIQNLEVRFPFDGIINSVYASCVTPGTSNTIIAIEKCSQDFIDGVDLTSDWVDFLSTDLTIASDKKSSNYSIEPVIFDSVVMLNDHFRINVTQLGLGLTDLTVEIKIKI